MSRSSHGTHCMGAQSKSSSSSSKLYLIAARARPPPRAGAGAGESSISDALKSSSLATFYKYKETQLKPSIPTVC